MIAVSKAPNRFILLILGLLLLIVGTGVLVTAMGLLSQLVGGWEHSPQPGDALGSTDALPAWLPGAVLAASAALVLLSLWWIITAVPRTGNAGEFQLHTDGRDGVTRLNTAVLQRAIAESAEMIPGVTGSTVRLEGTGKSPGLIMKVQVDERSDIADSVRHLYRRTFREVEQSLQADLSFIRLIVDPVRGTRRSESHAVELS